MALSLYIKPKPIHRPSEQGAALIVVISILLVLTLVGVGTINTASREYTINMNRTHAQHAEQIAKAGINLVINRIEQNPGQFIRALEDQVGNVNGTGCDKPRTICISAATFFPKPTTGAPNGAFHIDSLLIRTSSTRSNKGPSVYGDFLIRVEPPIKSPYTTPVSGMSLNVGAKMCTITLVLIGTGYVINPTVSNRNDHRHTLAERTYRVQLHVAMQGDPC
jgi:hypothetical protein